MAIDSPDVGADPGRLARWQLAGLHGMGSQRFGHADRRALEALATGRGEERRLGR